LTSILDQKKRSVVLWILACALLAYVLLLLNLPLAAYVKDAARSPAALLVAGHKKAIAALIALLVLAVGAALLWKRKFGLLWAAAALGTLLLVPAATIYKFQKAYPLADVFSLERYRDTRAILLGRGVLLSRYDPRPALALENHKVDKAAFPAIDVHFHLESLPASMSPERLIAAMDAAGIAQIVNLGGGQSTFDDFARNYKDPYPDRIVLFVKPDPNALMRPGGVAEEVAWLKKAAARGARGVKENKSFGLGQLDADGKRVAIDDPRLDPYWDLAGRLGWPVLVHTGEPKSFWMPIDAHNERFQELLENPSWSLYGTSSPSFEELMAQRERLLARHPGTNFIGAHFGMNPDDLAYTAKLLDTYPNYYVDMSSVVSELGRHPYSTRRFFIKYQDRILFGTDGGFMLEPNSDWPAEKMFRSYIEFLETGNEYIEYPLQSITKQGTWRVYGLDLPKDVLQKVYVLNAQRLIPTEAAVKERLAGL
jgi:predicted TIM-barrel fold metal-dependent hydrolase